MAEAGSYEMLWDCPSCAAKGLLGKSQRHCPQCGAPQDPDKRYFPQEGEEKRVEGHIYEGADWKCSSCDAPMGASAKNCTNCGAPRDGAEVKGVQPPAPPPKKSNRTLFLVLGVAALGLIIFGIVRCTRTVEKRLAVTGHTWTTTLAIDEWGDNPHQAWRNEMPASVAPSASCTKQERSTQQVPDGETCKDQRVDKKDGTFEVKKICTPKTRSEPVYDDLCKWTVREWHKVDEAKTSGSGLTLGLPTNVPPMPKDLTNVAVGTRKPGAKTQKLTLVFGDKTCDDVPESIWRKYTDGQQVQLRVREASGDILCGDLK